MHCACEPQALVVLFWHCEEQLALGISMSCSMACKCSVLLPYSQHKQAGPGLLEGESNDVCFCAGECRAACLMEKNISKVTCRKTSAGFLLACSLCLLGHSAAPLVFLSKNVSFFPPSTAKWGWDKDCSLEWISSVWGWYLGQRCGLSSSQAMDTAQGQWAAGDASSYFPSRHFF